MNTNVFKITRSHYWSTLALIVSLLAFNLEAKSQEISGPNEVNIDDLFSLQVTPIPAFLAPFFSEIEIEVRPPALPDYNVIATIPGNSMTHQYTVSEPGNYEFRVRYKETITIPFIPPMTFNVYSNYSPTSTTRVIEVILDSDGDGFSDNVDYFPFDRNRYARESLPINNINDSNGTGFSIAPESIGDINNDGFIDLLFGGTRNGIYFNPRDSYVVFGSAEPWSTQKLAAADLDGSNGFVIKAPGYSSSTYLDVNGDGIDDLVIGNATAGSRSDGATYVIFGSNAPWPATFNIQDLDGNNGFALLGEDRVDWNGHKVNNAGDVNGDGIEDLITVSPQASPKQKAYVVFGKTSQWQASMNLSNLNGSNGFAIEFDNKYGSSNGLVIGSLENATSAGDINNDGIDDIAIAGRSHNSAGFYGQSYVVFGRNTWSAAIDLNNLPINSGLTFLGLKRSIDANNDGLLDEILIGSGVSAAGDINNDGVDDFMLGGNKFGSAVFVVYGKSNWSENLVMENFDNNDGFIVQTPSSSSDFDSRLTNIGDFNGDNIDDLLFGGYNAYPIAGSYVVFGKNQNTRQDVNLFNLNGEDGFTLIGNLLGTIVSNLGDLNQDGLSDIGVNNYIIFGCDYSTNPCKLLDGL